MMVVVGINLLREGIDLPEVSLVAILDADKERLPALGVGTLSRPSGARHATSKARSSCTPINMTDSMKRAIEETNRPRAIQEAYNINTTSRLRASSSRCAT